MSFAGGNEQPSGAQLLREATLATTNYEGFPYAQTMATFPPAVHDVFLFDDLLTPEEKAIRYRTRAFMVCTLCAALACLEYVVSGILIECRRRPCFSKRSFPTDLICATGQVYPWYIRPYFWPVLAECLPYQYFRRACLCVFKYLF